MPPFDLWLSGRDDIFEWWFGPGIGCQGSRVIPTVAANGSPAFGQYKPSETGDGYEPWALQVVEVSDGKIGELTFFLDTDTLFPLFGLPARLESVVRQDVAQAHERDELEQLGRGVAQPDLAAMPPGGELEPGERVDGHRVDVDTADVAERNAGAARLPATRRHGRTARADRRGRSGLRSRRQSCAAVALPSARTDRLASGQTHRPMSSAARPRSYLAKPTKPARKGTK